MSPSTVPGPSWPGTVASPASTLPRIHEHTTPGPGVTSRRIAVLAPIAWRTPPRHYGPWELFASLLTDGLVALGHDVTLFATGDSITTAELRSCVPRGWSEDATIDAKVAECQHISQVFEAADEFDIIHNGFDFLPLTYSALVKTPVVTTIHGFSSELILPVYEKYDATGVYVAISDANRHPALTYAATIHHGIDVNAFHTDVEPGDGLLFFGRIHPDKGTAEAVQLAQRCNRPLVIAGIIQDARYFSEQVEPHLDEQVCFVGAVGALERPATLARAHALVHLIGFDEPFGYSVAEAMACGTPVIAYNRGSMSELIVDGVTGFLVDDLAGAIEAVSEVDQLDRNEIRRIARERFDVSRMASDYSTLYERVLAREIFRLPA
jgi:glycosyltransferase involved in cell wall biosynthesis